MILEIQHETRFEYSEAAIESLTELRMEPVNDDQQSCHSYHLAVTPQAEPFRYIDGFSNRVHHFNLLVPHSLVRILSASVVETHRVRPALGSARARFPYQHADLPIEVLDFLQFRGSLRYWKPSVLRRGRRSGTSRSTSPTTSAGTSRTRPT
jgi:transglutaminase-like putative cysteine protease